MRFQWVVRISGAGRAVRDCRSRDKAYTPWPETRSHPRIKKQTGDGQKIAQLRLSPFFSNTQLLYYPALEGVVSPRS